MAMPPPNVSGPPKPASSMSTMSTLGAPSGADGPGDERPVRGGLGDRVAAGPAVGAVGDRQHGAVGVNLPAASFSASLRPRTPFLSMGATDLAGEPASAISAARRSSASIMAMMAAVPGLSLSPMPGLEAAVHLVLGEPAGDAAGRCAHGDGAQQGRRSQADEHAHAAAPPGALAARGGCRCR